MLRVARLFFHPLCLFILLGFLWPASVTGQEAAETEDSAPPETPLAPEASPYLLDLKLGDSDLDLVWEGYWRMSFVAGGGFGKLREESVYPGLTRGTSFFQEPDVTLTLWMFDRWFIETTFLEGFERNTYRAGYMGAEDEFVREVVVGNTGVNANSYAEIDVPAPEYNTPGIVSKFGTDKSDHELLVRFDPTEGQSKVFQGQYEVNTQEIGLGEFVEGRFFILPDTGVSNVQVYLEDRLGTISGTDYRPNSTTRRYRLAEPVEFFVDNDTGLVELDRPHDGQVLVSYSTGFGPVGSAGGGADFIVPSDANLRPDFTAWDRDNANLVDFEWTIQDEYDPAGRTYGVTSRVALPSGDALVLYDPGRFTPFERQNVYEYARPLPQETWRIIPLLRDRGALYPATTPEYGFVPDPAEKTVSAYGAVGTSDGLRNPANRYPFADADPEVYGPGRITDPDQVSRVLVLAIRESNPGYYLGTGVVPGSVVVRVNGVRDKSAKIADDGSILFSRYIYLDDWIEVSYRTETLDMTGGDLFVYQGNRFRLTDNLTWELAESVRWNISPDRTSDEFAESPGEIKVATTLDWETDTAAVRLTGDAALSTPDTAGNLRLFGMDDGGLGLVFLDSTLVGPPATIPNPPAGTRIPADQYEYVSTDGLGRETLNDYLWPGASPTGGDAPGLASRRDGDPTGGRVMEIRFDIATTEWTSGDFLADHSGPIDLSGYTGIEFPVMFRNDYGGSTAWDGTAPTVVLQAGEIGESADHHEDGAVDGIDAGAMESWNLSIDAESPDPIDAAWAAPGTWTTVKLALSAADRARLESVRSFRIIIEKALGTDASGRFIMGAPVLIGSPFRTEIRTAGNVLAASQDIAGDEVTDGSLPAAYSEVSELFHPEGEANRALRLRWGSDVPGGADIAAADRWEAVSWFDGVPLEAYRTMVFYVNNANAAGAMTASATDENGKGVTVSWTPPATPGWDRITVNIADGTASSRRGGTVTAVSVDDGAEELTRLLLSGVDGTGVSNGEVAGTVYLDEVHFRDPAFSITGGAEVQASWHHEEDVAAIGTFPVLGDITLGGRTSVTGGQVLSGLDKGNTVVEGEVNAGADVMGIGVDTDWRSTWGLGATSWSGSHNLRIPARYDAFWLEDRYARGVSGEDTTFSRENAMNIVLRPGRIRFFGDALYDGQSLVQGWGGDTSWSGEHWNAGLDVRYVLNTLETPEYSGDYFSSWIKDYVYLAPSGAEVTNREAHHEADLGLTFGPASVLWTPDVRMKAARAPAWNQENRWAGTLSVPLRFEAWSFTTSYRRDLRQLVDISGGRNGGYDDAWGVYADGLEGQFPLFTYAPFRELLAPPDGTTFRSATDGFMEADYEAEFAMDLSRSGGTRIMDLFVPSTGDFSMERRYQRKGDTVGWENEWRGSLGFTAINLFGRFGRYPILPLYNSEELSSLLQVTLRDYNGPYAPEIEEYMVQTNWAFMGVRNRKLIMDYRIDWNWDAEERETNHEGRLEYRWRTPSKDVLHLPLVRRSIPRQHYMESTERFAIRGLYPWSDAPPDATVDFGFLFYHETSWVFEDTGHFKSWLALGLGKRDEIFTNGWELGMEAEFRF